MKVHNDEVNKNFDKGDLCLWKKINNFKPIALCINVSNEYKLSTITAFRNLNLVGGVWVHNESSDVMLLVICSETRGEILLRCHCSVKPHTAGQIPLTRCILWKSRKSVLFPKELRHGRGETGENTHLLYIWATVTNFNSLTRCSISWHRNTIRQ